MQIACFPVTVKTIEQAVRRRGTCTRLTFLPQALGWGNEAVSPGQCQVLFSSEVPEPNKHSCNPTLH